MLVSGSMGKILFRLRRVMFPVEALTSGVLALNLGLKDLAGWGRVGLFTKFFEAEDFKIDLSGGFS